MSDRNYNYDEFEATMLASGKTLDEIEALLRKGERLDARERGLTPPEELVGPESWETTPGPWLYDRIPHVEPPAWGIYTKESLPVRELVAWHVPVQADAQLMAAAPALLAVCQDAERYVAWLRNPDPAIGHAPIDADDLLAHLRQAIDRATPDEE